VTEFVHAIVPLHDGRHFVIDGNSKITASGGTYEHPAPNAFSLPHISYCPGSTPSCRASCYVHGLKRDAPDVYAAYEHNAMTLHAVLATAWSREGAAARLGHWIQEHCAEFRWHVSGDVFSSQYAQWLSSVCRTAHRTKFWIYTRSFTLLEDLEAKNLVVNLSADRDNWSAAHRKWFFRTRYAHLQQYRICYMSQAPGDVPEDLPDGSVIFPDYPVRGRHLPVATDGVFWQGLKSRERKMTCPVDYFGLSEELRCGFARCSKCMVQP
jgi:hypothetical protein